MDYIERVIALAHEIGCTVMTPEQAGFISEIGTVKSVRHQMQKLTDGEGGHVVREAYMVVCKVVRFTIRFADCVCCANRWNGQADMSELYHAKEKPLIVVTRSGAADFKQKRGWLIRVGYSEIYCSTKLRIAES